MIPGGIDRRSTAREASAIRHTPAGCGWRLAGSPPPSTPSVVLSAASLVTLVSPAAFWISVSTTALVYYASSTVLTGRSPGMRLTEALQQRLPALFAVQDRRAHA